MCEVQKCLIMLYQVARMVARHFQDLQLRELKAEREDALKMRRVASSLAKMVREFWTNIEKVRHQHFMINSI
jgi:hypothetical protein